MNSRMTVSPLGIFSDDGSGDGTWADRESVGSGSLIPLDPSIYHSRHQVHTITCINDGSDDIPDHQIIKAQ
jgi:hypothetical protein